MIKNNKYAERLLATYPGAMHAVAWTELMLCVDPDDGTGETSWDLLMKANYSPKEIQDQIRSLLQDEVDENSPGKNREALAEVDTPGFVRYIGAKMGLV